MDRKQIYFPVKSKLFFGFFIIIFLGILVNYNSYKLMDDVSNLVYKTYDKALMSGNFAQSAKFHYSQYFSKIKDALIEEDDKKFKKIINSADRELDTVLEDIEVVQERSLSDQKEKLIPQLKTLISKLKEEEIKLIEKKQKKTKLLSSRLLINEWNNNEINKKTYKLLNTLFDDAAESGYILRLNSEKNNNKNLNFTLIISLTSVFISVFLSLLLSTRILSPLRKLIKTCKEVDSGDYSTRSKILTNDEFSILSKSFDSMLNTIESKDKGMETLLRALPFGLFYFDKDGVFSKERSAATDRIFPEFTKYRTLIDFYQAHNFETENIQLIINTVFTNALPFEAAVNLLPNIIKIKNNNKKEIISLSFKPDYSTDKKLVRIIMIAKNITETESQKKKALKLKEKVDRVASISSDNIGFNNFVLEAESLYKAINQKLKSKIFNSNTLDIDLHSLKGILTIFKFNDSSKLIHNLETAIKEDTDINNINYLFDKSYAIFRTQYMEVKEILGLNTDKEVKYYNSLKIEHLKQVIRESNNLELTQIIESLENFPLSIVFSKYKKYVNDLNKKTQDKDFDLLLSNEKEISFKQVQTIDNSIMHIIRNCIDHGIENKETRNSLHKDPVGKIKIDLETQKDESITLIISDDGGGIDTEALAKKAIHDNIWTQEDCDNASFEDKLNLIFQSNFSSKNTISELSGRGVGMDAVKKEIEQKGGQISLYTKLGHGTNFTITLPQNGLNT